MKMFLSALIILAGLTSQAQSSGDAYVLIVQTPQPNNQRLTVNLPVDLKAAAYLSVVNFMEVVGGPNGEPGFSIVEVPALDAQIKNVRPRITGANGQLMSGDGVKLNLGKSGQIAVRFTGQNGLCKVKSTVREFYVPDTMLVSDCALYLKPGVALPTPGVTGSN